MYMCVCVDMCVCVCVCLCVFVCVFVCDLYSASAFGSLFSSASVYVSPLYSA